LTVPVNDPPSPAMAIWADFVITCVNHTKDGGAISTVGIRIHNGKTISATVATWPRAQVIRELGNKKTFVTATTTDGKTWTKGADVRPCVIDGETYIRTDANKVAKDNLGSLPDCS
jgi:hypothetical protein